jgi:hypothetical protein
VREPRGGRRRVLGDFHNLIDADEARQVLPSLDRATRIAAGGASREGLCGNLPPVPAGWTLTDIDELMSETMEGMEDILDQLPPGINLAGLLPGLAPQPAAAPAVPSAPSGPSSTELTTGDG